MLIKIEYLIMKDNTIATPAAVWAISATIPFFGCWDKNAGLFLDSSDDDVDFLSSLELSDSVGTCSCGFFGVFEFLSITRGIGNLQKNMLW